MLSVGNGRQARQNWLGTKALTRWSSARVLLQCFVLLSMPGLYRKKCKACQHLNSKECKRCGGAEGAGTTASAAPVNVSEGYGVSGACSYGYE